MLILFWVSYSYLMYLYVFFLSYSRTYNLYWWLWLMVNLHNVTCYSWCVICFFNMFFGSEIYLKWNTWTTLNGVIVYSREQYTISSVFMRLQVHNTNMKIVKICFILDQPPDKVYMFAFRQEAKSLYTVKFFIFFSL